MSVRRGRGYKNTRACAVFLDIHRYSEKCPQYLAHLFRAYLLKTGISKLASIVSFKDFEGVFALARIKATILVPVTVFMDIIHFKNYFKWILAILECTQKSFVCIASSKWTSSAWLTLDLLFDVAAQERLFSMIGGY